MTTRPPIHGLMAEFTGPNELISAVRKTREAGYTDMDAYSPYPIEAVSEQLEGHTSRVPLITLIGGIIGGIFGFGLQYWVSVIAYPVNIGGRPFNSWPAYIPITFETTVLFAGLSAVVGMLALNGLPMPYHPVFNVSRFARASSDRFFLCIEATDPKFDREDTYRFLERLVPRSVSEVDH